MTVLGTIALDGQHATCRRSWGAEVVLPLRCDPSALEAAAEALALARRVWHPGAYLSTPRIVAGVLTLDVVERPASIATAIRAALTGERGACCLCGAPTRASRCGRCRAEDREDRAATESELGMARAVTSGGVR